MTAAAPASGDFATRFAPSPTGWLHLGHAFSALTAWDAAQAAGGRFLLRIEDTDFTRCRPQFEGAIYEDLAWLGLRWEEPVRRQSEHRAEYIAALDRLREMRVLYRCFRTRKEVLAALGGAPQAGDARDGLAFTGEPPPADEEAARLERGEPFAWRLSLARARERLRGFETLTWVEEGEGASLKAADPWPLGDAVIGRKDIGAGYHVAAVVDDALQGVTHVIRGVDLAEATGLHRVLQALLALPTPVYRHHALLMDQHGRRLAKRDGATALSALRAAGVTPEDVRRRVGLAPA